MWQNYFRIFMDLLIQSWITILTILEIHSMVGYKDGIMWMKIQLLIGYILKDGMTEMGNLGGTCGWLQLFLYFLDLHFISKQSILQNSAQFFRTYKCNIISNNCNFQNLNTNPNFRIFLRGRTCRHNTGDWVGTSLQKYSR